MDNKKVRKFIFLLMLLISGIIIYGYINVRYNFGFPCIINKVFGVYCSGCGMTRAGIAMMQLDFYQAIRYNAFSVILIPLLFIMTIVFLWESVFDKTSVISKLPIAFWVVLFSCFMIYGIIRNFIPELQPINF